MVRQRSSKRRGLPLNLYERGGYYSWRDPRDGREHGLGRDRGAAIDQAIEANRYVSGETAAQRLVDRLAGATGTVNEWLDEFEKRLARRTLATSTRANWRVRIKAMRAALGELVISRVTTKDVAAMIDKLIERGQGRSAQHTRSALREVFRAAQAAGWVKSNPVDVTDKVTVKVMRARLTLDHFIKIEAKAAELDPWVRRSMLLALVTAQRREDISTARFADIHDGVWWVTQQKTGKKIGIPLTLRLDAIEMSVGDVISMCRDTVLSPWVIHHTKPRTKSKPGDPVWKDTVSKGFTRARELSGLAWSEGQEPPTFHEIRSLSERLYRDQGVDTQTLLGHSDARMTAVYHDARGAEWSMVKVR